MSASGPSGPLVKCGAAEEAIKCERHISLGGFGGPPPGIFFEF